MRCKNCGYDVQVGLLKCPKCNSDIHYWGKTQIIAGVEQSSLSIIDIFDDTFSKHIAGAGDRMFIAGTPLTTPEAGQMLQEWEKPWLYARVLIIGAIFLLLGFFMYTQLQHPAGYFVMSIIGSLLVPLSIVIFYWEINIPRDIPLYKIFIVFFIGGMLSLIFTVIGTTEPYTLTWYKNNTSFDIDGGVLSGIAMSKKVGAVMVGLRKVYNESELMLSWMPVFPHRAK